MSLENGSLIEENDQYRFVQSADKRALLFEWKHIDGLGIDDFRKGITEFASQCKIHRPVYAVIDAAALDQSSPAVAWLRAQDTGAGREEYSTWWARDIVPIYHAAGISSLAVGTGDPNAPGELASRPLGVNFKMGYFPDLDSALRWQPA